MTDGSSLSTGHTFGTHEHNRENKVWKMVVNGQAYDAGLGLDSILMVETIRCKDGCSPVLEDGVIEDRIRYWS